MSESGVRESRTHGLPLTVPETCTAYVTASR
jgi:hypothetical protein